MIAVDTSVLVAILQQEPEHEAYATAIAAGGAVIGAPTVLELKMVLSRFRPSTVDGFFQKTVADRRVAVIDFTTPMADIAVDAFRRYGRGRGHPAQLNFGDCMSYAVAKSRGIPLLFKGGGFALTDIEPAWRP